MMGKVLSGGGDAGGGASTEAYKASLAAYEGAAEVAVGASSMSDDVEEGLSLLGELIGENRPTLWLAAARSRSSPFYLYPALDVVRYSFTDATLLNPEFDYTLSSYRASLSNPDLPVLSVNFLFVVASVVLQLALGLLVALALHRAQTRRLPGVSFVRVVILCSWIVPGVASGIVWQLMFNEASYGFQRAARDGRACRRSPGSPTRTSPSGRR